MNEEKPSEPRIDGRPFDGGVGPTVQAVEGVPLGRPQLNADQLRGDTTTPSWKAPPEKRHGISSAAILALIAILLVILIVALRMAGVV
jgi:hypothetical protein